MWTCDPSALVHKYCCRYQRSLKSAGDQALSVKHCTSDAVHRMHVTRYREGRTKRQNRQVTGSLHKDVSGTMTSWFIPSYRSSRHTFQVKSRTPLPAALIFSFGLCIVQPEVVVLVQKDSGILLPAIETSSLLTPPHCVVLLILQHGRLLYALESCRQHRIQSSA